MVCNIQAYLFHQALKSTICGNFEGLFAFSDSLDNLALASVLVCCLCKYFTFSLPFHSNAAMINCGFSVPITVVAQSSFAFLVLSVLMTTTSPQHFFACLCMLLVDFSSSFVKEPTHSSGPYAYTQMQPIGTCRNVAINILWWEGLKNA